MIERVVVTGASSGIGAACVEMFQAEGSHVVGVDLAKSSNADDHLQLDLATPDCGGQLTHFLDGRPVDGLVNNAAIALDKAATDISASDFDLLYQVNLRAPLLLAAALRSSLAEKRGFVVNVASIHAVATSHLVSAYAATKGGLVSLTRALAIEWGPEVRVNAVLPGAIETDMLVSGLSRTRFSLEDQSSKHPLRRVGNPNEIAESIRFLGSNRFITGATLCVDGGATAQLSTE